MADKKVSQEEDYLDTYPSGPRSTHLVEINVPGVDSYKLPLEGGNSLMTLVDANVQPQMAQLGIAIVQQSETDAQTRADAAEASAVATAAADATTKSNAAIANAHSYTDAAVADIVGGGGGGSGAAGLFPGPAVSPLWTSNTKKNSFALSDGANAVGFGWNLATFDYLFAGPFVFSTDLDLTSIIVRSTGGDPGAVFRMGIYRSDPDSYNPTTLLHESAELDGTFVGYHTDVADIHLDAGKVYWFVVWAGVADVPLYMRSSNQDFLATRIIGADNDDCTTSSIGLRRYFPYGTTPTMPVDWPDASLIDAPTMRVGDRSPFCYATRD